MLAPYLILCQNDLICFFHQERFQRNGKKPMFNRFLKKEKVQMKVTIPANFTSVEPMKSNGNKILLNDFKNFSIITRSWTLEWKGNEA